MLPQRNYETLDAIVVIAALLMVTGLGAGLMLLPNIPNGHLPILASLVTAILGLPIAYGAFRWGNSVAAKQAAEIAAGNTQRSTDALNTIATAATAGTTASTAEGDITIKGK